MRFAALAVLALAAAGCQDAPSLPNVNVELVTATGDNPLVGRSIDRVRAGFRQGSEPWDAVDGTVNGQTFDVVLPIASYNTETELRYELYEGSDLVLLGATPWFFPGSGAMMRAVVAPPGSCVLVSVPTIGTSGPSILPRPRMGFGTLFLAAYALLIGGTDGTAPTTRVDYLDALSLAPAQYGIAMLPSAPGETRALPISLRAGLVVSEADVPFVFDVYGPYHAPVTLHAGAGLSSALVAMGSAGAAVLGGESQGQPVREISFVSGDGSNPVVSQGRLAMALSERAAAFGGGAIYVVSRGSGDAMLERIAPGAGDSTVLLPTIVDGVREDGILLASADGSTLLLLGGADAQGSPRTDTLLFRGCPDACTAEPGPTWSTARLGVTADPSGLLVGGSPPSALVEQVVLGAQGASIASRGMLEAPRSGPGVVVLSTGVAYVLAGLGTSGPRDDYETCVPFAFGE